MASEDQELNLSPASDFPTEYAFGSLLGEAVRRLGRFTLVDQTILDAIIVESGYARAKGALIGPLCLHYRHMCRRDPAGDHYPALGTIHFWFQSQSYYLILYISPQNDWFKVMALAGEEPGSERK